MSTRRRTGCCEITGKGEFGWIALERPPVRREEKEHEEDEDDWFVIRYNLGCGVEGPREKTALHWKGRLYCTLRRQKNMRRKSVI